MAKYSDKSILIGIKNRKDIILKFLYKEYYPQVHRIVTKHGGNEQDSRDLFQEALIIIFKRVNSNELTITTSFHNYFIVLCRFIWFRQNDIKLNHETEEDQQNESPVSKSRHDQASENPRETIYKEFRANQYEKIYQRQYRKLGGDCKAVLQMFFKKKSFKEIAAKMNYCNEKYARRKKYLCMQHLMKMVNSDPEFIELKKDAMEDSG